MHKKGAKLSLVHLFGLSKINRNYIQKGREIRRNMKRMKKVLSIVLSLAMILTSITVYNTKTAKAAGLFPFKYGQIDRGEFIVGANQINVVFSWDRNTYPVGQYTFKVYYENNQIISNDGAWEQVRVPFGRDSYTFRVDVCDKENNNEVVATDTFDWTSPTNNDCGVVATVGKVASLSWKPISGAVRYAVLVDDSIIADNITDVSYECEVSANEEHNITINAYNSDGEIIESTNNTAKVIIETRTEDTKTAIIQEPIELTGNEKWVAFDKKTKEKVQMDLIGMMCAKQSFQIYRYLHLYKVQLMFQLLIKMVKVMNIQILQIKQTLKYGVETIVYILTKILLMLNQVKKKSLE